MPPFSRRDFLSSSAGLSAAALAAADLRIAAAQPAPAPAAGPAPSWSVGPFEDLRQWIAELERRFGLSGIAEKAARDGRNQHAGDV